MSNANPQSSFFSTPKVTFDAAAHKVLEEFIKNNESTANIGSVHYSCITAVQTLQNYYAKTISATKPEDPKIVLAKFFKELPQALKNFSTFIKDSNFDKDNAELAQKLLNTIYDNAKEYKAITPDLEPICDFFNRVIALAAKIAILPSAQVPKKDQIPKLVETISYVLKKLAEEVNVNLDCIINNRVFPLLEVLSLVCRAVLDPEPYRAVQKLRCDEEEKATEDRILSLIRAMYRSYEEKVCHLGIWHSWIEALTFPGIKIIIDPNMYLAETAVELLKSKLQKIDQDVAFKLLKVWALGDEKDQQLQDFFTANKVELESELKKLAIDSKIINDSLCRLIELPLPITAPSISYLQELFAAKSTTDDKPRQATIEFLRDKVKQCQTYGELEALHLELFHLTERLRIILPVAKGIVVFPIGSKEVEFAEQKATPQMEIWLSSYYESRGTLACKANNSASKVSSDIKASKEVKDDSVIKTIPVFIRTVEKLLNESEIDFIKSFFADWRALIAAHFNDILNVLVGHLLGEDRIDGIYDIWVRFLSTMASLSSLTPDNLRAIKISLSSSSNVINLRIELLNLIIGQAITTSPLVWSQELYDVLNFLMLLSNNASTADNLTTTIIRSFPEDFFVQLKFLYKLYEKSHSSTFNETIIPKIVIPCNLHGFARDVIPGCFLIRENYYIQSENFITAVTWLPVTERLAFLVDEKVWGEVRLSITKNNLCDVLQTLPTNERLTFLQDHWNDLKLIITIDNVDDLRRKLLNSDQEIFNKLYNSHNEVNEVNKNVVYAH